YSHRWGIGEPEFRDMSSKIYGKKPVPVGPGYDKLVRFCEIAEKDYGCAYAWSDTCCINKESSAELEEAIRSMYRWYEEASMCIILHLAKSSSVEDFAKEPWFTRGWTLQELLAPRRSRFFGKDWTPICPKEEESSGDVRLRSDGPFTYHNDRASGFMLEALSQVTDIDINSLREFERWSTSIHETMSWASKRETTRVEDVAYSLLGIFDISMPMAYGEGERAFHRLMEAIAQRSTDPTLFAW
ncbi:hypothetical protein BS17DRAFT_681101, partial [Gyrodon lividus]